MKDKLINFTDYLVGKLGYFKIQPDNKDLISDLSSELYNQTLQVRGLTNALGEMQLRLETANLVITALVALTGEESIQLTIPYLAEIQKSNVVAKQDADSEKMTLTLVLNKQEEETAE